MWYILHSINQEHKPLNVENYKSVRIKSDTYKKLKLLSVETEIPITKLIDLIYAEYLKSKTHLTSPP